MLYIYLLGHLRLFEDGRALDFAARPKTLPLWAYLLLNRDRPAPRDRLAYLLWPDLPERRARADLRRHLYDLRQALPPASSDRPWLLAQAGTVQWNPAADYWLDVAEFERLSGSPDHLAKAVALYSGDLLPDLYEDWIFYDRERLRDLYLADLSQLVLQSRARNDLPCAIAYAQRILHHDPLREDAVRDLIGLSYQAGDRAGALQAYQRFVRRLEEELGATPMPETRALYEAVRRNAPLPEIDPATSVVQPVAPCPHNLPAPLNAFVGRAQDLVALRDLIVADRSRVRLLTLTGPAGVGKTRLALEMATRLLVDQAAIFPDGIFFVDLAAIGGPDLVLSAIAEALAVEEPDDRPLLEGLKEFLRPKYLLLLLDNFEHVVEAGPQIAALLAAASNLRVLATSRAALHLYGEQEYPLSPLPLPDLGRVHPAQYLLDNAAVSLFVARAQERSPAFSLTEGNAADVAEICVRLDGLPLAIELAAGQIKALSPSALLARLVSQLTLLVDGPRDLPARHRTLRGAIDWSYGLLSESEKLLFSVLGVFAGGSALEAVEAVCGPLCEGDVADGLASLVDKSLLQRSGDDGESCFSMVASIREYALERLQRGGDLEAVRQRYAGYYSGLAERARQEWRGPEQSRWLRRLREEQDNLRAVLSWLLGRDADAARIRLGAQLVLALFGFWETRGRLSEARAWHSHVLEHRGLLALESQVQLLSQLGWFTDVMGDYQAANGFYREALTLSRQIGDRRLIGDSLHALGVAAGRQGEYERAEALLSEAIAAAREASDGEMTRSLAAMLNNLAIVVKYLGDYARAMALLQESLAFKRARGDQLGVATSLTNLGNLALVQKDYVAAEAFFRESLLLRQALGDRKGILPLLSGLAELAMAQGESVRSVCLYSAAAALRQTLDFPLTVGEQETYDRHIAMLRRQLDEADFAAAWAIGESMTLDQVVAYALGQTPPDSPPPGA